MADSPKLPWPNGIVLALVIVILSLFLPVALSTECWRQRLAGRPSYWFAFNHTIKCPMTFQWTVADFCCYDTFDRDLRHPFCCYSEVYKLAVAVGFICLVLLGTSFFLFFCWFYNLPHHLLYLVTFKKFRLNEWLAKARNSPYVDPTYYSGEPFWARGSESQPYPLRPMPPRIFYPPPPGNMKFRWDMNQGDLPLFVLASRQFHRNPYSARPHDRTPSTNPASTLNNLSESRRSSITTLDNHKDSTIQPRGSSGTGSLNGATQNPRLSISSANGPNNNNQNNTSGTSGNHHQRSQQQTHQSHSQNSSNSNNTNNTPNPSQYSLPFVINVNEEDAAAELLEAIRLLDEKDNNGGKSPSDLLTVDPKNTSSNNNFVASDIQHHQYAIAHENGSIFVTSTSRDPMSVSPSLKEDIRPISSLEPRARALLGKLTIESMNQQLSSSLSLSISNLPNVQVVGNFSPGVVPGGGGNGNQMETIVEDDDLTLEGEMSELGSPLHHGQGYKSHASSKKNLVEESPRISSALDRIVTRARQEIPFRPSLPGSVPDSDESSNSKSRLSRRNSAPVNY